MTTHVKAIPEGFHSVTPGLVVRDAAKAIEFYKKALGAYEVMRMLGPDNKIVHAQLRIADSIIFISDELPNMGNLKSPQSLGGCTAVLNVYVPNVDELFKQAIAAGGRETMPVTDQFWGDRHGSFVDPFGLTWGLLTHKEDVSPRQLEERAQEFYGGASKRKIA